MADVAQFDRYLSNNNDGPAAIVLREWLMPVEGPDGVLFPATFAAGDGFPGGYNIDGDRNGDNVCLIDSVGSQANRIEPLFMEDRYQHLVPQIVVIAGSKDVNLLKAGHRAGDAIVRCSGLQETLQGGFKSLLLGNAQPLAKIAPTSLVFGVWDSRGTQAKLPRLVASTIRAYDVQKLTRHAQFIPAVDYVAEGILEEPADLRDAEGKIKGKHPFAQRGFTHIPITKSENTHGGVVAHGGIRRDATLGLAALRLLNAADAEQTITLRRYILGLSLVALTANTSSYLRQGCMLVLDPGKLHENEFVEVYRTGERRPAHVTHEQALEFGTATAEAFGVGDNQVVSFEKDRALKDVKGGAEGKIKPRKGKAKQDQPEQAGGGE